MASYTTNLNLKKPAGSENVAIGDINNNMDLIDNAYGALNSKISVEPTVSSYNANIGTKSINARKIGKMVMVSGYFTLTGSVSTTDNLFNVPGIDITNYGFVAKSGGGFATIYTDENGNIKANQNMSADTYYINDVFAAANL